jgi:hypothetical protein
VWCGNARFLLHVAQTSVEIGCYSLYTVNSNKEDETEDDEEQSPVAQTFLGVIYIKPFHSCQAKKSRLALTYPSIKVRSDP